MTSSPKRKPAARRQSVTPRKHLRIPRKLQAARKKKLANELRKLQEIDLDTVDALPHTQKHDAHIKKVCISFVKILKSYGAQWESLLEMKEFELPNGKKVMVPAIFIELGGKRTPEKLQIANKAMVKWMRILKKIKLTRNDKFTWYQPVTQNQMLRTFIGHMSKTFFGPLTWMILTLVVE